MAIFITASIGCAISPDIVTFLIARIAQSAIAACFSIALVVIKESSDQRDGLRKIGSIAMGWALAPMLAPTIGGLLATDFGWRAIFIALALMGAGMLAWVALALRETAPPKERRERQRDAYRQLLFSPRFLAYTSCMAWSIGTLYIFLAGAPLVIAISSAELGLYMGLVPAGFIFGSFLSSRYRASKPLGATLMVARSAAWVGLAGGLILSLAGVLHILAFFVPCMFIGIGNGMAMPAANMGALSVRPDLAGTAAGLVAAVTVGGGAVIAFFAGLVLSQVHTIPVLFALLIGSASSALLAALVAARWEKPEGTGSRP